MLASAAGRLTFWRWLQQQAEGCIAHSQVVIALVALLVLPQVLVLARVRQEHALQHLIRRQCHLPAGQSFSSSELVLVVPSSCSG